MRALLWLAFSALAGAQALPGDRVISSDAGIGSLSFSADGTLIAATCEDGKVRLWDARTGELKRTVSLDKDDRITLADRAEFLIVGGREVRIIDVHNGEVVSR